MQELLRHIIHEAEVLEITSRTLATISQQHDRHVHNGTLGQAASDNCLTDIAFYQRFLSTLQLRATIFSRRLENERNLVIIHTEFIYVAVCGQVC
jgi:hypothetical protein